MICLSFHSPILSNISQQRNIWVGNRKDHREKWVHSFSKISNWSQAGLAKIQTWFVNFILPNYHFHLTQIISNDYESPQLLFSFNDLTRYKYLHLPTLNLEERDNYSNISFDAGYHSFFFFLVMTVFWLVYTLAFLRCNPYWKKGGDLFSPSHVVSPRKRQKSCLLLY